MFEYFQLPKMCLSIQLESRSSWDKFGHHNISEKKWQRLVVTCVWEFFVENRKPSYIQKFPTPRRANYQT